MWSGVQTCTQSRISSPCAALKHIAVLPLAQDRAGQGDLGGVQNERPLSCPWHAFICGEALTGAVRLYDQGTIKMTGELSNCSLAEVSLRSLD